MTGFGLAVPVGSFILLTFRASPLDPGTLRTACFSGREENNPSVQLRM